LIIKKELRLLDKILNIDYYNSLVQTFSKNVEFNSSLLDVSNFNKINLSFIQKVMSKTNGFDIIIKIPKYFYKILDELYSNLYLFIANAQFYENYMNPEFKLGELVVKKVGKKNRKYKVIGINDRQITLVEQKKESLKDLNGPATIYVDRKNIVKEFVPIKRSLKKGSLNNFLQLFSSLNGLDINEDYFPTKFGIVTIFVGSKKIFENFRNFTFHDIKGNLYNSIPCYYINRDGKESDTLGISPLLYFVSSYRIAYQQIIKNKIRVCNVVLFGDGFDELQQIISDQSIYGFRIIGICTTQIEKRMSSIKYWEWHKEEINLIQSL
jgi:hypothetical protein